MATALVCSPPCYIWKAGAAAARELLKVENAELRRAIAAMEADSARAEADVGAAAAARSSSSHALEATRREIDQVRPDQGLPWPLEVSYACMSYVSCAMCHVHVCM